MSLPPRIERWLSAGVVPQRLLLTGNDQTWETALEIAARLQGVDQKKLKTGLHGDTLVIRDTGTFKIGEDKETDPHTVRGMIRWAHQKPP